MDRIQVLTPEERAEFKRRDLEHRARGGPTSVSE
jgi:hypothetical protein